MFCQRCRTPLRPDTSLDDLNPASLNLLVDAAAPILERVPFDQPTWPLYQKEPKALYDRVSSNSPSPTFKRMITPAHHAIDIPLKHDTHRDRTSAHIHPAMSFVMLTDSQVVQPPPDLSPKEKTVKNKGGRGAISDSGASPAEENRLSHKMETTARLFEILSSRSDIDHPVCTECTEVLIEGMEKRLANATRERDAYADYLRDAVADVLTEAEQLEAQQELTSIQEQEKIALAELETLEAEKAALEEELAELEREAQALDAEEAAFWRERNAVAANLAEFQAERDSINVRYDHDARQLERLQRTNVYNDTFCISHNGYFGTINNLRLGRLANHGVEWAEINAAWGQTCLLIATVAEKLGYTFQGYRLHPMGSTSTIDKITETPSSAQSTRDVSRGSTSTVSTTTNTLPLHYSSELPLGIGFLHRNFDAAMVAFLECVRQLGRHVERSTAGTDAGGEFGLRLPYEIKKDRINECSIKLGTFGGGGGDESWTKACKWTLTCCKFLLAHASNAAGGRRGIGGV